MLLVVNYIYKVVMADSHLILLILAASEQSATHEFNSSGNLVLASGSGIDFSANSNASGMTSEVLDDSEDTWTPGCWFGKP